MSGSVTQRYQAKSDPVILGVRRWGEDDTTPIALDGRGTCGTGTDHIRNGCIGIVVYKRGSSGLIHLTTVDALRLSDLLRAMANANTAQERSQP